MMMGAGEFKQPPQGPKIGAIKTPADLPEDRRREIEELDALGATPFESTETRSIDDIPASEPGIEEKAAEGVAKLEALRQVLEDETPEETSRQELIPVAELAAPTDEDKQELIRCFLGDRLYHKTYELCGGAVKVEMTDIPAHEMDKIFALMKAENFETVDDWEAALTRYCMVKMIVSISVNGKVLEPPAGEPAEAVEKFVASLGGSLTYRTALQLTHVFQHHIDLLLAEAFKPDF